MIMVVVWLLPGNDHGCGVIAASPFFQAVYSEFICLFLNKVKLQIYNNALCI
jgi:hypothetical protein